MLTAPCLLVVCFAAAQLLTGCGSSPDTSSAGQSPAKGLPAVEKVAPSALLTAFHATTQRLATALPAPNPEQEAARQLTEYIGAAVALAAIEAQQGRDSTVRGLASVYAMTQQDLLYQAEALPRQLIPGPETAPAPSASALRQRLRATVAWLVAAEQATRVEAVRQQQTPTGMMSSYEDGVTGNVDTDFAAVMLLQQRAALEAAGTVRELASSPALKVVAARQVRQAQAFIPALQAWPGARRRP